MKSAAITKPLLACSSRISHEKLEIRMPTVIAVKGKVCKRDADTINKKIVTGEIEIDVTELEILGPADGRWLVRAPDHERLCDALALAPRPTGRLRVNVDPSR